ncbi:hypothetical protein LOTGIDRAFT_175074 [Lottia gigantea]|uniref:Peptidase S1 domain-containing protein n=1 Tax=Lottia gigantea TaxID=225164 RepID=V4AG62_LOTGI|nr:hypothetical protein LOTGIDRAFT_175074 [Lottia gigantea]ESO95862.1 hypothetical protein LOTGIDRAFT_175074 [Lottia gigantea]
MTPVCMLFCLVGTQLVAEDCGIANGPAVNQLIVGGTEVHPRYKWPWVGMLIRRGIFWCAGSLIQNQHSDYFFITTAHCVDNIPADEFIIKLGSHFNSETIVEPDRQYLQVDNITTHPNFDSNTFENDIGILQVKNTTEIPLYNDTIRPICWANQNHVPLEFCTVVGWGALFEGGSESETLQEAVKPILDDTQCTQQLGSSNFKPDSMLCSGVDNGGIDTCTRDSGGPFFCHRHGHWQLVGITSFGLNGCGRPNSPGVYTDCWDLKPWVESVINSV